MSSFQFSVAKIFTALLLATSALAADVPNDFKCGPIDCDTLKNHPDARFNKMWDNAKAGKPRFLDHIAELRTRFWEMYSFDSTSKDCDDAREQFAQALFEKDLHYLQPNVIARIYAPNPHRLTGEQEDLPTQLADLLVGGVDGGIPRSAQPEFYAWVNAMRDALGPARTFDDHFKLGFEGGAGILTEPYRKAMNLGGKEYQEYVMERDWAEFAAINRVPAGYNNKETYGVLVYFRAGNNSFRDSNAIYAGMEEALGKDVVQAAAERVRTAPKTETGDLVQRDLGEPVKLGPGGSRVDDYDAPVPKGDVIGIYKDPALAMEILATQDDDRRYLLYLLKHQYWKNASSIKQAKDEWTFAAALYKQLTIAFGEQDVLEFAGRVRTATKRWISGNVMDQKAIGATRNVPLEAFEDILARKNPKGYVRATLAFDQNPQNREAVDAAYQKLVASSSEKAVLDTAQKVVAGKPTFGYRLELPEFVKAMNAPPAPEKPAQVLVDYPLYLAWKGFEPGAKASYVSQVWVPDPRRPGSDHLVSGHITERHTFTLRSITSEQALFWLTEIAYDADGAAHPAHDSEFAYPAKIPLPNSSAAPAQPGDAPAAPRGKKGAIRTSQARATAAVPALNAPVPDRLGRLTMPAAAPTETGEEILDIHGRRIATRWQSVQYAFKPASPYQDCSLIVKVWTSDAVPSGLVRKTQDRICPAGKSGPASRYIEETYLESFEGVRPGVVVPDASAPATTTYVPPPAPPGSPVSAGNAAPPPETEPAPPAQTPQPPAPGKSRPAPAPADAARRALAQRYTSDIARYIKARRGLNHLARKQDAQGIQLPADVSAARDRLDAQFQDAMAIRGQRDNDQAEQRLQTLEDSVAVVEKYLKEQS
jgi:hypothetical protein